MAESGNRVSSRNPFDTGISLTKKKTYREAYRTLPPLDVFILIMGVGGPNLWDNVKEVNTVVASRDTNLVSPKSGS